MYYFYVEVKNYTEEGFERTFVLNPKYTKTEIRNYMENEKIEPDLIEEVERNGIYLDTEVSFETDIRIELYWRNFYQNGTDVICIRNFFKKGKLTFYPNATYLWMHTTTFCQRKRIWHKLKEVFHKKKLQK